MGDYQAVTTTIIIQGFTRPEAVTLHCREDGYVSKPATRAASADICFKVACGEDKSKLYIDMPLECRQFELLQSAYEQAFNLFISERNERE